MESAETQSEKQLKFKISFDELKNSIPKKGTKGIMKALRDTGGVISLRDMNSIFSAGERNFDVYEIPESELFSMLRGARDATGNYVYKNADFEVEKVNVSDIFAIQTFVSENKLAEIPSRAAFLKEVGINPDKDGNAYVIKMVGGLKYASILIPPVMLEYKAGGFKEPISKVTDRIAKNDMVKIKVANGIEVFDIVSALAELESTLQKGDTVTTIKDGTHRAYSMYLRNEPVSVIRISNQEEKPTNVPVRFNRIIRALEKPSKEDRYPGFTQNAIAELKLLGIDS
ncbi:MAG: hypothetical protein M1544_00965 [Candidatus Marsarchaeota archaeon]|nr:hypothetical protein [Candidatus Marsarchaeota archaeon]MCL5101916.1 hypothetical protein [Candidatus Marsarchaeota archaeon]